MRNLRGIGFGAALGAASIFSGIGCSGETGATQNADGNPAGTGTGLPADTTATAAATDPQTPSTTAEATAAGTVTTTNPAVSETTTPAATDTAVMETTNTVADATTTDTSATDTTAADDGTTMEDTAADGTASTEANTQTTEGMNQPTDDTMAETTTDTTTMNDGSLLGGENMNTAGAGNDMLDGAAGASAVAEGVDTSVVVDTSAGCEEGFDQECTDYCEEYLSLCTNQFSDYTDMDHCMTECSCFPRAEGFGGFQGNTLQCRIGHFGNITDGGNVHCWHAGIQDDLCSD